METIIELLHRPWPWYISGPLIGLMVPLLLLIGNKPFGISISMRHICAACIPSKADFFKYNWKEHTWNLVMVFGIVVGGFIGGVLFENPMDIQLSDTARLTLAEYGITDQSGYHPAQLFNWEALTTLRGLVMILLGGFMVGFGTRYANGCTSGHSIMGISTLNWVSVVATISFFIGGLLMSHFIMPYFL